MRLAHSWCVDFKQNRRFHLSNKARENVNQSAEKYDQGR